MEKDERASLRVNGRSGQRSSPSRWVFITGTSVVICLYVLGTLGRAHQKLFWHDEIYTVILAPLPFAALWTALKEGVDLNPPLFYIVTRASQAVFGYGLMGTRMPALAGVLVAAVCCGVFVRRRYGPYAGLVAALLLLSSDAYPYAYEGRPYGLVLGLAGLALVCWQSAVRPGRRAAWLGGLTVSLATAIACHYYAVLLILPIAAGELYRMLRRRQTDWPLWTSVAGSLAPLVVCWSLVGAAREFSAGYFSPPSLRAVLDVFPSGLSELTVPVLAAVVAIGGSLVFTGSRAAAPSAISAEEQDEWVVAVVLLMLPFLAYVMAVVWTHALVSRHYLPWTLGFSIVVPITIARLGPYRHAIFATMAGALIVWFGARQALSARWLAYPEPSFRSIYPTLVDTPGGDSPIVIGHSHVYLVAVHYAPPELASRLVFPAPAASDPRTSGTAIRAFRKLQTYRRLRLENLDEFTRRHPQFMFYGPTPDPVLDKLSRSGALIVLRGEQEDRQLFPMSRPGSYRLFDVTTGGLTAAHSRPPPGTSVEGVQDPSGRRYVPDRRTR